MADNVYEMMAKIGLDATALMAGLSLIGIKLGSLTGNVEALSIAMKGLGAAIVVVGIVKSLEDIAKAGGEVNHQIEMMKSIGMTSAETVSAMAQAQATAFSVPTTNIAENLKHLQELRYIFGGVEDAEKYIDHLSRINDVIGNIKAKDGSTPNKDQVFDLAKSLEMKNLTADPKEFMAYANAMLQVIQSSGGKVTAQDFRSAVQYGRVSALSWDKEFIGGALGRMIQEYSTSGGAGGGAGGPGNALMSMSAALIQGKMTKTSAARWEDLGFNNPRFVGIDKEHGRELMQTNPYEWVQKFLMPALAAKGITDQNAITDEVGKLFGVRTAAGIVSNMATGGRFHMPGMNAEGKPNSPFEKDIALQKLAEGEGSYDRLIKQDYPMIMKAFNEQWKTLLQVIGSELMAPDGPVIRAMASLVSAFSSVAKFFADNPKAIDGLLIALAGIAAAFAAFAVSAAITVMTMLAPGGLIIVAIAGLVAALGTLAGLNWENVKNVADSISSVTNSLANAMTLLGMNPFKSKKSLMHPDTDPNIHPQNFEGVGPTGPRLIPANFSPGEKKQILQPVTITLNIDGRALAQSVSDVLEDLYTHPTSGPAPNGWSAFRSVDGNVTGT